MGVCKLKMAAGHVRSDDDCSEFEEDSVWIEIERAYQENSTEEKVLIDWLKVNVDVYLAAASEGDAPVSIDSVYSFVTFVVSLVTFMKSF